MAPSESDPALTAPTTSATASTGSTASSIIISREPPTDAYGLPLANAVRISRTALVVAT